MSPRRDALKEVAGRKPVLREAKKGQPVERFGRLTFNRQVIQKMLSKEIAQNIFSAMIGKESIKLSYADAIASAMREWACNLGATTFCHWFQPMTGIPAEKHDGFIDWKSGDMLIEKFSGKQLLSGEPDASSFPSGGLRQTAEARGYTSWDPTSYPFLWQSGGAVVLCIPSVFYSWTGETLDMKIPLLRSDDKIHLEAERLLRLCGKEVSRVYSTLGCEQEYFLIDRSFFLLRPDLHLVGRTVCGAPSPKGQELEDHYFGTVKERVIAFMEEMDEVALELAIPLKTRHNEVAPSQHEAAPIFERASQAVDHNILLMELMRQTAIRHHFACLMHEKPFAGINGSGKHNNWSLASDTGINLLDPSTENSLVFLILLTAILEAVHKHAALLRASIASAGNDHRLGGNEAPPAIISVYLGKALEELLDKIEKGDKYSDYLPEEFDLGIQALPKLPKDQSDRNRTSPFAFTGNKFEFRSVGASANCALPVTVLNVIIADSLHHLLNEIEKNLGKRTKKQSLDEVRSAAIPVIRESLKTSKPIRFTGNNYSEEWKKEAKRRKLPIIERSFDAFKEWTRPETARLFQGILSKGELHSRFEIMVEHYAKEMNIEAKLLVELFQTQILPASMEYQKQIGKGLRLLKEHKGAQKGVKALLQKLSVAIDEAIEEVTVLEQERSKALTLVGEKSGAAFSHRVNPQLHRARDAIDALELMVDDRLWPLPKYRELLFLS